MAKFQEKMDRFKQNLFRWGKILFVFGATQLGGGCKEKEPDLPKQQPAKVVVPPKVPVVENPVGNSVYVVDTLDVPRGGTLLFCSGKSIVRYFLENNDSYRMRLYLFVHEQRHKDNYLKGLRSVKVSPEQYAKICMHDEISANIAALLTLRYEYLTADDKASVIKKYENSEYDYYFRALKARKIFPEKEDSVSRDNEWSFIMNETCDMWMRRYAPVYQPSIWRMVERYTRRMDSKISASKRDLSYRKGLKIAYHIGGVDFSRYMDKDIEPQDKNFSLLDQIVDLKICNDKQDEYFKSVRRQLKELENEHIPVSYDVVMQVYLAESIKSALSRISKEEIASNPELVGAYYNRLSKHFSGNQEFQKLVCSTIDYNHYIYSPLKVSDKDLSEKVYNKIYKFKELDLRPMIPRLPRNLYSPTLWDNVNNSMNVKDMADVMMLDFQLEKMRQNSKKETLPAFHVSAPKQESRKSGEQIIAIPDFTQPILIASTPEQIQEIKQCIDDFYAIPAVMRHCDLKAQNKFLKKQQDSNRKNIKANYRKPQRSR